MALQYITNVASKASPWSSKPVLTDEDEAFLQRVTSNPGNGSNSNTMPAAEGEGMSPLGRDAQTALMDGAQDIPLPMSPSEDVERELPEQVIENGKGKEELLNNVAAATTKKRRPWTTIPTAGDGIPITDKEQKEEQEDLAIIMERLNLAAENNRAFSVSDETQQLLSKFKLIFKDLVTGVPTAYRDLESLLTNGDKQLKDAFGHLPGFLQKLVQQLPEKFTESLGPELMAVAGERASRSGVNMENAGKAAVAAQKMGFKAPSLKELVGKPTAIAVVLLALWYCHKRGKEVRLENERLVTEAEITKMNEEYEQHIRPTETLSTTAPRDAPISDVRDGVEQVRKTREQALASDSSSELQTPPTGTVTPSSAATAAAAAAAVSSSANVTPTSASTPAIATATGRKNSERNRFSLLRTFSKRTKSEETSNIQPYPGT
ncbi:hypothetical protein EIK77_005629 [Talaromyces pinophilus]|nr:hypothetical protein EIK77_005629 [Talaromyces pinophilus]